MDAYQQQLQEMRKELATLQRQLAAEKTAAPATSVQAKPSTGSSASKSDLEDIRERQSVEQTEIATHEQTKVETESKYPLKVNGLLLLNEYVNTRQVDVPMNPTYALEGSGSTGLSLRQTVLGLDARGPHLFGATSSADLRVDFFATGAQSGYTAAGLLRLRTVHARLSWQNTEISFAQDRSLLAPNLPSSLVAVAQPEFSWSGNLWTWNPQILASHNVGLTSDSHLELQAGLIDPSDPLAPGGILGNTYPVSSAERSRWPGAEARIGFASGDPKLGTRIGISGYFSPHRTANNLRFDAWAGAIDWRIPLGGKFGFSGNAYRGAALGDLGGGGYVDYVHQYVETGESVRALDDVGGWLQLQSRLSDRLQFNAGYGIDNPFAGQIHSSTAIPEYSTYPGLARNRSAFGNVIYSPNTSLLFSLEYRRLWTNYASGPTYFSDVIGIGAGYRF
jgi:hypothetical protein